MIFLIGLPASGKSTLMRALATAVPDLRTIDLDDAIEAAAGKTVPQIFAAEGEAAFRRCESDTLRRLVADGYQVIACGGGTPCQEGNMEYMQSTGTVVHLTADTDRLVQRLLDAPGKRPMAEPYQGDASAMRSFIEDLRARRAPHYNRATAVFDSSLLDTADEIDATVNLFINRFLKEL